MTLDSADWERQLSKYSDRTVFHTKPWLTFVAKTQNAHPVIAQLKDGSEVVGCFAGLVVKKFGLRILGSPFPGWTTSYMGICLTPGVSRREALEALTRFAFQELRCVHLEVFDRRLTAADANDFGWDYRLVPGFEIDLTRGERELFESMSSACRRCIRKAEKSGVVIEEAAEEQFADEYYTQLQDVFAKQSLVPPYGVERVRELVRCLGSSGMLLLLRARDAAGHCIGTGLFPAANDLMYFWGGASWRQYQQLRPNELIQWHAIKYWKQRGIQRYDMGGGGEYKRKYGGVAIAVPWIRKSKYESIAALRMLAQNIIKAQRRVLGKLNKSKGRKEGTPSSTPTSPQPE